MGWGWLTSRGTAALRLELPPLDSPSPSPPSPGPAGSELGRHSWQNTLASSSLLISFVKNYLFIYYFHRRAMGLQECGDRCYVKGEERSTPLAQSWIVSMWT